MTPAPINGSTEESTHIACSRCTSTIRRNSSKAVCTMCGKVCHLICTQLPRTLRDDIRDGRREWTCCDTTTASRSQQNEPTRPTPESPRLMDGAWCTECRGRIRIGARRLRCLKCRGQFHIQCMTTTRSQVDVAFRPQGWCCPSCTDQPKTTDNRQTKPTLDPKSTGVQQANLHILQWNANGIHRELPLLEKLLEELHVDIDCIQESRLLPSNLP